MTKKQDYLYWSEWQAVRKAKPDADRHEMHVQALGADKSHKDFSNEDFDKVLGVFRAISKPASLNAQLRQLKQTQTRLIFQILNHQVPCLCVLLQPKYFPAKFPIGTWDRVSENKHSSGATHAFLSCFHPAGEDDVRHAEKFIQEYMHDVYKCHDIQQLSYEPRERFRKGKGGHSYSTGVVKSDLECLRDTIAVRINDIRAGLGLTIHDMLTLAGLTCECSQCCKQRRIELRAATNSPQLQPA